MLLAPVLVAAGRGEVSLCRDVVTPQLSAQLGLSKPCELALHIIPDVLWDTGHDEVMYQPARPNISNMLVIIFLKVNK